MSPQEALDIVSDWVENTSSFVETFEPEDWGTPDRFDGDGLDEAMLVLTALVSEPLPDEDRDLYTGD